MYMHIGKHLPCVSFEVVGMELRASLMLGMHEFCFALIPPGCNPGSKVQNLNLESLSEFLRCSWQEGHHVL